MIYSEESFALKYKFKTKSTVLNKPDKRVLIPLDLHVISSLFLAMVSHYVLFKMNRKSLFM